MWANIVLPLYCDVFKQQIMLQVKVLMQGFECMGVVLPVSLLLSAPLYW